MFVLCIETQNPYAEIVHSTGGFSEKPNSAITHLQSLRVAQDDIVRVLNKNESCCKIECRVALVESQFSKLATFDGEDVKIGSCTI